MARDRELSRFYAFLAKPLFFRSRFLLALLVVPLLLALTQPLWRIEMYAPQYPEGLRLDIYAHTIEGGHEGRDIKEINILNHYIGMRSIERHDLADLDWIPFALGLVAILTLRCAAVGDVRSLIDVVVLTLYLGAFGMMRFVLKLRAYGHDLNPDAPVKVPPFTPPLLGQNQLANFETWAGPQAGTYLVAVFALGSIGILLAHLVMGRRRALGEAPAAVPAPAAEAEEPRPAPDAAKDEET